MELKLAKNESLIKSWEYAQTKQGFEKKSYELTVTDKRIISSSESSKGVDRREIYLDDVKTLEYSFAKKGLFKAILFFILGAITAIAVVGIFLIIKAIGILKEKSFELTMTTEGFESDGLEIGASSMKKIFSFLKKKSKLKVKVNKDAALEIINELGAIIVERKTKV